MGGGWARVRFRVNQHSLLKYESYWTLIVDVHSGASLFDIKSFMRARSVHALYKHIRMSSSSIQSVNTAFFCLLLEERKWVSYVRVTKRCFQSPVVRRSVRHLRAELDQRQQHNTVTQLH